MFLNINYQKIIQEYSLDHCFILEWAASLFSCTEYCIADLVSLVLKTTSLRFCRVRVKTFRKNSQILLCCCDSLGVQGTVCFGFMISVLLIGSNCFHYTVLGMEGSFNLLGSWIFFPFCTHYVTRGFEKMYEGWNFNSGNYLFTTDTK